MAASNPSASEIGSGSLVQRYLKYSGLNLGARRAIDLVARNIYLPHPPFKNFARKSLIKMRVNQGLKGVSNLFIFTIAPISAILREISLLNNIGKQFSIGAVRNT
jgi:hypothetical protein